MKQQMLVAAMALLVMTKYTETRKRARLGLAFYGPKDPKPDPSESSPFLIL